MTSLLSLMGYGALGSVMVKLFEAGDVANAATLLVATAFVITSNALSK